MTAVDDEPLSRPTVTGGASRGSGSSTGRAPWSVGGPRSPAARWVRLALVLIGLTVAVLPAVLSAHRALDEHWRPVADNPRIAADATAFAAGHPPLLGAESTSLEDSTHITPIYHPGPAESWLLGTVQAVWRGTTSLVVSVATIAAVAAAVIVLAARKLAGAWAALAAGAMVGVVSAHLGTPILADIWNPYVAVLPLAAAVSAAAAAAFARWKPGLPLAVLFATISVQSHITYAPLFVAALVPVLIIVAVDRRTRRRRGTADPAADDRVAGGLDGERAEHLGWATGGTGLVATVLALLIGVVLWFPPVLSEATADHSNVANLWRAATTDTGEVALGTGYALQVFDRVVGRPPPFGPPAVTGGVWVVPRAVSLGVSLRVLLALLPMVAVLVYGLRRRDRLTKVIGASVLAVDLMALALLRFSTFSAGAALYQTRWLWAIAILHWGGLAVAVVHVIRGWSPARERSGQPWLAAVPLALAALTAVIVAAALVTTVRPPAAAAFIPPDHRAYMRTAAELQAGLEPVVRHDQPVVFRVGTLLSPPSVTALNTASALMTEGVDVRIRSDDPDVRRFFGPHYAARAGERGQRLVVTDRRREAAMRAVGYQAVAATPALSPAEQHRLVVATRRLRAQLHAVDLRWTAYGQFVHLFQTRPDVDQLLDSNRLPVSMMTGELRGPLPSRSLVDTVSDLQRRSRPDTSFVVWRRPGRTT